MFTKGILVKLTSEAQENECYASFAGETLRITHVATRYMPSKDFYAKGRPEGYHPGYDPSGGPLYDLETVNGKPVPCSLYQWELRRA